MSLSVKSCCIKGCTEKSRKKRKLNLPVKFYCFPSSSCGAPWKEDKRTKWINAVKNYVKNPEEWEPNKHTRICSAHFINNSKSEHPLHPSYIPSIFLEKENTRKSTQSLQRFQHSRIRQAIKNNNNEELMISENINNSVYSNSSVGNNNNAENNISDITMEQNIGVEQSYSFVNVLNSSYAVYRSISCQTEELLDYATDNWSFFFCSLDSCEGGNTAAVQVNLSIKKMADKMCEASIPVLKKNVQDSSCNPINFESIKAKCPGFHGLSSITTDEAMSSFTGVTFAVFLFLLSLLPDCKTFKLDKETKLLITLTKLKTGLTFTALSVLFNVHRTTVNRIFIHNLRQLNIAMKNFIFWPSKAAVQATLPEAFKLHYPETRVIIDCTEVNTEVPSEVKHRVLMYSDYKHHHTIKFLVGCTPNGLISFLSKCYGGRAGDCFITNDCGIIDLIEPGDVVLADKGFPQIKTKVEEKNAIFVMPPFCYKDQFTPEEVDETYNIASVRIHIERVNQRIKDFKILSKVPISLLPYMDEIVFVICCLVNVQKPLFKQQNQPTSLIKQKD